MSLIKISPKKSTPPVMLSPVRHIRQVATRERICSILLTDGPCALPANPDIFRGKPLTLVLAETLERYGAKGTFCVVGDTGENYPDKQGKPGSDSWNGVKWDHWPDFGQDRQGGAVNCPQLMQRLLAGGHEIASHGYTHRPFGGRGGLRDLDDVVTDLRRLHSSVAERWGYPIRLAQPPTGCDDIRGGFTSFDAFALMNYQYMDCAYDGGCRLSLGSYQAEVEASWRPVEQLLLEDPDAFCGKLLSLRDGRNNAHRTPVAEALERQLRLLRDHGYRVIPASELLERSAFADVLPEEPVAIAARRLLSRGWCPAYQDNTLRPGAPLLRGELAMMAFGWESIKRRVRLLERGRAPFRDMGPRSFYAAAAQMAWESGSMTADNGRFRPEDPVTAQELQRFCSTRLGSPAPESLRDNISHGEFFLLASALL